MNEPGDMVDRRLGKNAMPEIEDEGARGERGEDRLHAPVKGGTARDEKDRIEIALHRDESLQPVFDESERLAGIAADRIDARLLGVALGVEACAAREADHGRARRLLLHPLDDPPGRGDAPAIETVFREAPGPTVENLERPSA